MNRTDRMMALQSAGVNTSNFFDVNMRIPVGANVQILVDGVPYTVDNNGTLAKKILDCGYVFNRRTDGRFVTARTFKMLNEPSYNYKTGATETGWDAYLRNNYPYMYQFEMMKDEFHKMAKMFNDNDPDLNRLNRFFTKNVAVSTCCHYLRRLNKYIKAQPRRTCKGQPYYKFEKYGNVFANQVAAVIKQPLNIAINKIRNANDYKDIENAIDMFISYAPKLPADTPKCSQWKDAFKGKGAYVTLLNIVKFHGVTVIDNNGNVLDTRGSVAYIDGLLDEYDGEYWRFHEMLKAEILRNDFDLKTSIAQQRSNN